MCAGVQKRLEELWEDPKLSVKCINLWSAVRGKLQWFILAEIGFLVPLLTTVTIIVAMFKAPASTSLLLSTEYNTGYGTFIANTHDYLACETQCKGT